MARRGDPALVFLLVAVSAALLVLIFVFAAPSSGPRPEELGGRAWPGVWPVTLNDTGGAPVMMAWRPLASMRPGDRVAITLDAEFENSIVCGGAAHAAVSLGQVVVGIYPGGRPPAPCQLGGNTDVYLVVSGPGVYRRIRLGDVCSQNHYSLVVYAWLDCNGTLHIDAPGLASLEVHVGRRTIAISADTVEDANPSASWCNPHSYVEVTPVGHSSCQQSGEETPTPPVELQPIDRGSVSYGTRPDSPDNPAAGFFNGLISVLSTTLIVIIVVVVVVALLPLLPSLASTLSSLRRR